MSNWLKKFKQKEREECECYGIVATPFLLVLASQFFLHNQSPKIPEAHIQPTHKVEKVCPVEKPTCSPSLQKSIHSTRFNITSEKI